MNFKLLFSTLLISAVLLTSCSKSDDNGADDTAVLGNSYFTVTVGDKEYKYPCATTNKSSNANNAFTVIVLASAGSNYDSGYGIYSGGALTISCNLQGEGEYTITDNKTFATNPSKKMLSLGLTVGTGTQVGYLFESQVNSGKASIIVENGNYHVTIASPTTLKKLLSTGTSKESVPETVKLTVTNGYAK